jgi:NitT/TauT family transport system substrate-binding protein
MGKTLEQFKGKKLGAPRRGSLHDVFLRFYISQHGLEDKVDVLNYDWADFIPDAIMNGEVEGAAGTPPLAVLSSRLFGGNIVIPASRVWPNNPSYGIVTRKELLLDKPNLLELFLKVHKKGCALIREDPLKAAEVIAKTVQLVDDSFVRETLEVSPKYCASLSKEYVDSTLALLPVLMNLNYLSKNLEKEDIFDFSLIEKVHPEPPHY